MNKEQLREEFLQAAKDNGGKWLASSYKGVSVNSFLTPEEVTLYTDDWKSAETPAYISHQSLIGK